VSAKFAFLGWLLHDPTAPPRSYVKHLIFRFDFDFYVENIRWSAPQKDYTSSEWPIERLTTQYPSTAVRLFGHGLRPQRTFRIDSFPIKYEDISSNSLLSTVNVALDSLTLSPSRVHQVWAGIGEETVEPRIQTLCIWQFEMDPETGTVILPNGPDGHYSWRLTIQLTSNDCVQRHPDWLLKSLAAIFVRQPDAQVTLACAANYRLGGQTVADFIRAAIPAVLPVASLENRLRISHEARAPIFVENDPLHALAQAAQCGRDPWDEGQKLRASEGPNSE